MPLLRCTRVAQRICLKPQSNIQSINQNINRTYQIQRRSVHNKQNKTSVKQSNSQQDNEAVKQAILQSLSQPDAQPQSVKQPSKQSNKQSSRPASFHSSPRFIDGQLTRDFISASLYESGGTGYFNAGARIHSAETTNALVFNLIKNRDDYYTQLRQVYTKLDKQWLTPVEIFKPHYAHAIARWMKNKLKSIDQTASQTLRIVEVGGGNGTCAKGILDYLQTNHPDLYEITHYTIVDLSEQHREIQAITLASHMSKNQSNKQARVEIRNESILDWNQHIPDPVFVIGLEVLDNMPHDKVTSEGREIHQTHVHRAAAGSRLPYTESTRALTDAWIEECLTEWENFCNSSSRPGLFSFPYSYGSMSNNLASFISDMTLAGHNWLATRSSKPTTYLPTTALHFFHVLHHFMPNHHLLLCDFSSLPDTISGVNSPIVSGTDHTGQLRDFDSYLVPLGVADIFFPTDFEFLAHLYESVGKRRVERDRREVSESSAVTKTPLVQTSYEFMKQFAVDAAKEEWSAAGNTETWRSPTRTRSGFDPLLEDYVNFKFLTN